MQHEKFFAALANKVRLNCLSLLSTEGELCVCKLTEALHVPQPTVSRHLAILRKAALVQDRREGYWVHYRINPSLPHWARSTLRVYSKEAVNGTLKVSDKRCGGGRAT